MPWTEEQVAEMLGRDARAVERAVARILQWRVETDQQLAEWDRGKSHWSDSNLFVSFAQRILSEKAKEVPSGERLTPKQVELARIRLRKFLPKLTEFANAGRPTAEPKVVEPGAVQRTGPIVIPSKRKRSEAWKDIRVTLPPLEPSER